MGIGFLRKHLENERGEFTVNIYEFKYDTNGIFSSPLSIRDRAAEQAETTEYLTFI